MPSIFDFHDVRNLPANTHSFSLPGPSRQIGLTMVSSALSALIATTGLGFFASQFAVVDIGRLLLPMAALLVATHLAVSFLAFRLRRPLDLVCRATDEGCRHGRRKADTYVSPIY